MDVATYAFWYRISRIQSKRCSVVLSRSVHIPIDPPLTHRTESKCHAVEVCFMGSLHLSRDFALYYSVSVSAGLSLSLYVYEHQVTGVMRVLSSLVAMITGHLTALMEARERCWDTCLGTAGHLLFPFISRDLKHEGCEQLKLCCL